MPNDELTTECDPQIALDMQETASLAHPHTFSAADGAASPPYRLVTDVTTSALCATRSSRALIQWQSPSPSFQRQIYISIRCGRQSGERTDLSLSSVVGLHISLNGVRTAL